MRNFFSKLVGGKDGTEDAVQDLLKELREGERVSREVWDRCRSLDTLEDVFHDAVSRETLAGLAVKKPESVYSLVQLTLQSIEDAVTKEDHRMDFEEEDEVSLANAIIVLTAVLAAGPGGPVAEALVSPDSIPESEPAKAHYPLLRLLWEQNSQGTTNGRAHFIGDGIDTSMRPTGERIIDGAMRALFLEGFSIESLEGRKAGCGEAGKDIIDGIDVECMWYSHVGPTLSGAEDDDAGQPEPNDDTRENRCLALQLLLAALCGGSPATVLKEEVEGEAKDTKKPARGRSAKKETPESAAEKVMQEAQVADVAFQRPLISDSRFLAYLQDPERNIPWRGELLYSLLGLALDYDPHGYGVPYGGLFFGAKKENFVSLALQVLGLLLQCGGDLSVAADAAVLVRKPQELLGIDSAPLPRQDGNVFQSLLAGMSSSREVEFIEDGIATLFGTVGEDRRSYLPGSTQLPCFLAELMVLVYHLSGCADFVKGLCKDERKDSDADAPSLAEYVLQLAFQGAPEHLKEDDVVYTSVATLMRLTAYHEFCDKLNEEYEGDSPDELPSFNGSYADLVALAAIKAASDKIGTAHVNRLHRSIVEAALCTLCNISVFAEGLCLETCFRLFKLFERCGKANVVKKGRNSIGIWLPRILEIYQNVVQYQYSPNLDIVYGLMTRESMLRDLVALCEESKAQGDSDASATTSMPAEWWMEVEARLHPVIRLLDAVVPTLTAEVEKNEISSPSDAKKLLPRTALGLLPVPHPFELRSIRGNFAQHRALERCLIASVAHGPSGLLWDDEDEEKEEEEEEGKKAKPKADNGKSGGERRERSSSLTRRKGANSSSSSGGRGASSRTRSSSRARQAAAAGSGSPGDSSTATAPAASADAPAPNVQHLVPSSLADGVQAQLQAAVAAGVDVAALMQALAAQQAAAAAPAGYPPAADATAPAPSAPAATATEATTAAGTEAAPATEAATPVPLAASPAATEAADSPGAAAPAAKVEAMRL